MYTPLPIDRSVSPGRVLVEETDPAARLDAHLELGRRAAEREEFDTAETHFREALELDPTDERPKAELRGLGRAKPKKRRLFKSFW
jgi:hypothetical protein